MKIPSTVIHIEVAKAGEGFVVLQDIHNNDSLTGAFAGAAQMPSSPRVTYIKNREDLQTWLASFAQNV